MCTEALPAARRSQRALSVSSRNYQDLIAWQRAMQLVEAVYRLTNSMPVEERFGLTSQMRRAAVAIPANIAEGQGRRTCGAFRNHLSIAHGSIRELETHVMLAGRLGYMSEDSVEGTLRDASEVGRLVTGLANSLDR